MANFSPTDAAFAGFRLMRERPRVILAWAGVFFLANLVNTAVMIASGAGEAMAELQALQTSGNEDPAVVMTALGALGPVFLLLLAISLAFYALILSAAFRVYLRPGDSAPGALRFGGDELRMAGLLALLFLIWSVYFVVLLFVVALVVAAGAVISQPLANLLALIVAGVMVAYPWVRLSLVWPMTLDTGRLSLASAWKLTHGLFWRLFVTYGLTALLLALVGLLSVIVMAGVLALLAGAMGLGMAGLTQFIQPDLSTFSSYFNIGVMASLVLNALLSAALLAIWAGPMAEAYAALRRAE